MSSEPDGETSDGNVSDPSSTSKSHDASIHRPRIASSVSAAPPSRSATARAVAAARSLLSTTPPTDSVNRERNARRSAVYTLVDDDHLPYRPSLASGSMDSNNARGGRDTRP